MVMLGTLEKILTSMIGCTERKLASVGKGGGQGGVGVSVLYQ